MAIINVALDDIRNRYDVEMAPDERYGSSIEVNVVMIINTAFNNGMGLKVDEVDEISYIAFLIILIGTPNRIKDDMVVNFHNYLIGQAVVYFVDVIFAVVVVVESM